MFFDLQKASLWKRASAWLFDRILLGILAVGFGVLISAATGYDSYSLILQEGYSRYEQAYGISFDMTEDEYSGLSQEDRARHDAAYEALAGDSEIASAYMKVINFTILITSLGIFLAYLALEFILPLSLGNGQTLGKKIFGIALMRTGGLRVSGPVLFSRTLVGKYAIETMVPVYLILMIYFGKIGLVGTVVLGLILILQLGLLLGTRNNSLMHDLLADTVVVDFASQMIFGSEAEMLEARRKAELDAEAGKGGSLDASAR